MVTDKNEISDNSRNLGKQMLQDLQPSLLEIEKASKSSPRRENGAEWEKKQINTIIDEFWTYYSQFSFSNIPKDKSYLGEKQAELKITVLLHLFQELYLERVYPQSTRFPIVHFRYIEGKTLNVNKAKYYLVSDTMDR